MPEEMPETTPEDRSENMPENILPKRMPEHMSEDMREAMPEDMSETCHKDCQKIYMPERMWEEMSEKICQEECQKECQKIYRFRTPVPGDWRNHRYFSSARERFLWNFRRFQAPGRLEPMADAATAILGSSGVRRRRLGASWRDCELQIAVVAAGPNQEKGRGEEGDSDEIYRPKGSRFHQSFPLLLVLARF